MGAEDNLVRDLKEKIIFYRCRKTNKKSGLRKRVGVRKIIKYR